jgi:transposase
MTVPGSGPLWARPEEVMAYREVTMLEVKEVLRQWLGGDRKKAIARRVGVARNTVRAYIKAAEDCGLKQGGGVGTLTEERLAQVLVALRAAPEHPRGEAWAQCETQRDFVAERLKQGLRLTKIRKLLLRRGVKVPYPTLHRFAVAELDFGRSAPTIPVADCAPGEELQVDTGWMGYLEPDEQGRRRRYRAWIFTSVCTRHRFVYPSFHETTAEAIEACEAAWAFFGGIFRVLIPDNTKAIVQRPDPLNPLINRTFLEYAQARDFSIDPTRIRSPKDKGRVERAVQPTRDDCFAGEQLKSLDEARMHGRHWCLNDYGRRRHTRTQRLPLEHFESEEKTRLGPAPTAPYEVPLWCEPKVAPDQHAQVAKALYSLPRAYRGHKLEARADRTTVRFYDGWELVKTHPRQPPGGRSTDPADFPPEQAAYALRDVAFLERQAQQHGASVGRFAHALLEGPLPWTRMRRAYALLGLCRRYGSTRVDETCALALAADMLDVRRLARMLQLARPPQQPGPAPDEARVIPLCRYLRPPQQYALPLPTSTRDEADGGDHR